MGRVTVIHNRKKAPSIPVSVDKVQKQSGSIISGVSCSLADKIRVAAYCRVSTLQEEQELSYETQRDYYKTFIEKNPDYYLVDIYGDQGKSGLNAEGRPEFQRMMRDCRNGRIDRILTKSVSRFARNYSECLEFIRELNALGVIVCFEKEAFTTADSNINMILSFIAILAQEEVNSLSQAHQWSNQKRNRAGDPIRGAAYGYTREKKAVNGIHHWHIKEEEARRVRKVYELFLEGLPYAAIVREMLKYEEKHGVTRKWTGPGIKTLLTSEVYVGDILTNKTYKPDYTKKRVKVNNGERERQHLKDHHPAIISREDKEKVIQRL